MRSLVAHPPFTAEAWQTPGGAEVGLLPHQMQILGLVTGAGRLGWRDMAVNLAPGQFCLVPACLEGTSLHAQPGSSWLRIECGSSKS